MAVFSGYLMYILATELQSVCYYCIGSAAFSLSLMGLSIFGREWDEIGQLFFIPIVVAMITLVGTLGAYAHLNQPPPATTADGRIVIPSPDTQPEAPYGWEVNTESGASEIELAKRTDDSRSKVLPAKLKNKSFGNKSIQMHSEDFIYADQSELKINNTNLKIFGLLDTEFLTKSPEDKLSISYNDAINTNDPSINFSSNFVLSSETNAAYSRPNLNLRSPLNEIEIKKLSKLEFETSKDASQENSKIIQKNPSRMSIAIGALEKQKFDRMMAYSQVSFQNKEPARPKIRPNKYPFEIKEIPKEYARPRVRPDGIEELAAKSQIFSDGQVGQSIKPKVRPKFRKRLVASDYSEEGDEASVTGTILSAATKKSIVKLATQKNTINKRKLNVLSIYSRGSEKRAIVLFPTGQTKLVKVGDRLDGGRVAAIGTSEIRYIKGGNNLVLKIPQG